MARILIVDDDPMFCAMLSQQVRRLEHTPVASLTLAEGLKAVSTQGFDLVLQERRFRALGSFTEEKSDFRLIAATNRDLQQMVDAGQFRRDLFFRLQTLVVNVPPLRERPEDIKELAIHYMVKLCERYEMEIKGISPDFTEALQNYSWPGNVRELIHTMEWVLIVAQAGPTLYARHLPTAMRVEAARTAMADRLEDPEELFRVEPSDGKLPTLKYANGIGRNRIITLGSEQRRMIKILNKDWNFSPFVKNYP